MNSKPPKSWNPSIVLKRDPLAMSKEENAISTWLAVNLKKKRKFRQNNLYIHGPTKMGKTSLINRLRDYIRVYDMPLEDFYDFYDDNRFDLIVIDEFNSSKPITFLNMWLDGQVMTLRVKGGQVMKKNNLPTIILSNKSPEENYPNTHSLLKEAWISRLKVVELKERINIFK